MMNTEIYSHPAGVPQESHDAQDSQKNVSLYSGVDIILLLQQTLTCIQMHVHITTKQQTHLINIKSYY